MITRTFIISGKVQGVAYRYYAKQTAEKMHINGYVKNQFDGTVKLIAQAEEGELSLFEAYLYKGSPHSIVENIEIINTDNEIIYKDFSIN
jgi:acylphosphatase